MAAIGKVTCPLDNIRMIYILYNQESQLPILHFRFSDRLIIQAHSDQASSVDFDDHFLVTGSENCTVGVWSMDISPGKNLHYLEGHTQAITEVRILNANESRPLCVSASYDTSVRLWSVTTGLCLAKLVGMNSNEFEDIMMIM